MQRAYVTAFFDQFLQHKPQRLLRFADYQLSVPAVARAYGVPDEKVIASLGTVDRERTVAAQRAYLGAYFDQFLKGRPQRLLVEESPRYPDVKVVR